MQTIKQPDKPEGISTKSFWGIKAKCDRCGATIKTEEGDDIATQSLIGEGTARIVGYAICPHCGSRIMIDPEEN